jgi:transcriptional regulator with XRE-family HTH domain
MTDRVPARALTCRRPLSATEYEAALQLGQTLRQVREHLGLPRTFLARQAQINEKHLWDLEHGYRRTRPSTLRRLADGLCAWVDDVDPVLLTAELVALAGPAIAAESQYRDRVDRRRAARTQRPV